jgi:hypothetical protein
VPCGPGPQTQRVGRRCATAFSAREVWAWWALLIANALAYGSAMTYDRMVGFIGTNEMLEYVCLGAAYAALAVTAPFRSRTEQDAHATRFEAAE